MLNIKRRRSPLRWIALLTVGCFSGLLAIYFFSPESPGALKPAATAMPTDAPVIVPTDMPTDVAQAPEQPDIPTGTRILIPSLGVAAQIVQVYLDGTSWDVSRLGQNVGHLKGTAWLPTQGNVVLLGHVEMANGSKGIFASLKDLRNGDLIVLQTADGDFRYQISEVYFTDPTNLEPIYPQTKSLLTLITCDDYDFVTNVYNKRLIVVADQLT